MTPEEQDQDVAAAQAHLAERFLVDRCRHESVDATSLWIFDGATQIGSVSRTSTVWKANRLSRGLPVSELRYAHLTDALDHVTGV